MANADQKSNSASASDEGVPAASNTLRSATKIELKAATMLGDMRGPILDQIRLLDQPWTKLKNHEQRKVVSAVEGICRDTIRQMVGLFSRIELPAVGITIGAMAAKDETLTVKISCEKSDDAALALLNNPRATLVFVDEKTFMGEREAAKVDPDQVDLPFADSPEDAAQGEGDIAGDTTAEAETAPGGLSPEEAERAFEASNAKAEEKRARRRQRNDATRLTDEERGHAESEEGDVEMPSAPRAPVDA